MSFSFTACITITIWGTQNFRDYKDLYVDG